MAVEEMTLEEGRMQNFQKIAITVAFSFTCFSVPVLGATKSVGALAVENVPAETKKPSVGGSLNGLPARGGTVVVPGEPPGTGAQPGTGEETGEPAGGERVIDVPTRPDWLGSAAPQVRALKEQFRKEHTDLLKAYKEMLKQAKEVGKEEREKVRDQFKVQREELIARQRELREDLKRRFEEFRAEHPEHLDVIDAAKERTKEAIRERRGHGQE